MAPYAVGPYVIVRQITRNTFELDIPADILGRASPVFHSSNLIPYETRLLDPEAAKNLPPVTPEDQAEQASARHTSHVSTIPEDQTDQTEVRHPSPIVQTDTTAIDVTEDSEQASQSVPPGDQGDPIKVDQEMLPLSHAPQDLGCQSHRLRQ